MNAIVTVVVVAGPVRMQAKVMMTTMAVMTMHLTIPTTRCWCLR
jgi:hypothetical protein